MSHRHVSDMNEKLKKMKRIPKRIGKYKIEKEIGTGASCTVYKGVHQENKDDVVAIKSISIRKCSKDQIESVLIEINLLKQLSHPSIVKYLAHKKTKKKLYIFIEYIEQGSLSDLLKKRKKGFTELQTQDYIYQVLKSLEFVHSEGIVHRDIKGANILLGEDNVLKLADFGVAADYNESDTNPAGTPYWMAPEVIEFKCPNPASDIWSVGCLAVELLTTKPPYFDLPTYTALYRIVQDHNAPLPKMKMSYALKNFLICCFERNVKKRRTASQLVKHRWFANIRNKETLKRKRDRNKERERKRTSSSEEEKSKSTDEEVPQKIRGEDSDGIEYQQKVMKILGKLEDDMDGYTVLKAFKEFFEIYNDPEYFEMFERVGGIKFLIPFLSNEEKEYVNQAIDYLQKMIKFNILNKDQKKKIEKDVCKDLIEHLIPLVKSKDEDISEKALGMYNNLIHSGQTRRITWEINGFDILIYIMDEKKKYFTGFDILVNYLQDKGINKKVEKLIIDEKNMKKLLAIFDNITIKQFGNSLDHLLKLLIQSKKLTKELSTSSKFLKVLKIFFLECKNPFKRFVILKIIKHIYMNSKKPKRIVQEFYPVVQETLIYSKKNGKGKRRTKTKDGSLVKKFSLQLITAFEQHIKC